MELLYLPLAHFPENSVDHWDQWSKEVKIAVDYAKFYSRSHHALIHVYDDAGNVIETHEHKGDFKEW